MTPELRALRLDHYRKALEASRAMRDKRCSRHTQDDHRKTWAFHMGAVQALNDCFRFGDTAEKDLQAHLAHRRY